MQALTAANMQEIEREEEAQAATAAKIEKVREEDLAKEATVAVAPHRLMREVHEAGGMGGSIPPP